MQKILVIGATGMIGKPVTQELLKAKLDVTLMVRNGKKARTFFPDANIVSGDVFDPLSLLPAFEGKDIVYISLGPERKAGKNDRQAEEEGIENIILAAQKTGAKRLILLSSLVQRYNGMNGYHWWLFDVKIKAVEKVKASGIPYTIFYPSSFMETFDQLLKQGNYIMLAGRSVAPMYFIAAKDYGKQLVRSISQDTGENKEYVVQGPEAYTWHEGSRIFIAHYKKATLRVMKAPLGILQWMGKLIPVVGYSAKIMEALNNYPEKFESRDTWDELGTPGTTIRDYASQLSIEH